MKKINVCLLERIGGGYFLWSLSQVTVWPGTSLLTVLWTKGLILQPSFHTCTMCVRPFLLKPAAPIRAQHLRGPSGWGPEPLLSRFPFWISPVRKQIPWTPCDPSGQTVRGLEKHMNSLDDGIFLASSAQVSTNRPVQTGHETTTKVSWNWMSSEQTQGRRWDSPWTCWDTGETQPAAPWVSAGAGASGDATRESLAEEGE